MDNLFNVGGLEILIVLLLAFLVMGPRKVTRAARTMGKWTGEVKKMGSQLTKAISDTGDEEEVKETGAESDTEEDEVKEAKAETKEETSELPRKPVKAEKEKSKKEKAPD